MCSSNALRTTHSVALCSLVRDLTKVRSIPPAEICWDLFPFRFCRLVMPPVKQPSKPLEAKNDWIDPEDCVPTVSEWLRADKAILRRRDVDEGFSDSQFIIT